MFGVASNQQDSTGLKQLECKIIQVITKKKKEKTTRKQFKKCKIIQVITNSFFLITIGFCPNLCLLLLIGLFIIITINVKLTLTYYFISVQYLY